MSPSHTTQNIYLSSYLHSPGLSKALTYTRIKNSKSRISADMGYLHVFEKQKGDGCFVTLFFLSIRTSFNTYEVLKRQQEAKGINTHSIAR